MTIPRRPAAPLAPLALLALLAPALAACPRPLRFGPEGEILDPRVVLERLDARSARLRSVKGEARVHVRTPRQSGTVSELVAAQRPASLHLESLDFFGKPAAALTCDGASITLYLEQGATFYTGPATAANIARLLVLELEPRDAVRLLLGDVPRLEPDRVTMALDAGERAYRLTLWQGGASQELWVATEDLVPLRSRLRAAVSYDVAFDDFEDARGWRSPRTVELTSVGPDGRPDGVALSLRFQERELDPELPDALFALEPPPGATRVELDAEGRPIGGEAPPPRGPLPGP